MSLSQSQPYPPSTTLLVLFATYTWTRKANPATLPPGQKQGQAPLPRNVHSIPRVHRRKTQLEVRTATNQLPLQAG